MPQAYTYQRQGLQALLASSLSIALYTRHPQGDAAGAELTAPGYSRQSITLVAILNLCAANQNDVTWLASGTWPVASYFAICRTADGSMVYWGALPAPLTASAGSTPTIKAGSLLIDWVNPVTGMAVNWGAFADRAPVGDVAPVTLVNRTGFLTGLPSGLVTVSTYKIVPADQAAMNLVTVVAEQQLGAYLLCNVFDATRGSTAGYTVAGPTSLAF
jgi:hypothetical protein